MRYICFVRTVYTQNVNKALTPQPSPPASPPSRPLIGQQRGHPSPFLGFRVQAAARGWPVLGDVFYGSRLPFGPRADLPRDRVIALHARSLTFLHPIRYEPITVTAPLPDTWCELFPAIATP